MAYTYKKGFFKPRNPSKYKGDINRIVYRSGLELKFMLWLDSHKDVISWASEEHFFVVPYRSPFDNRSHRYFPDFWFQSVTVDGEVKTYVIEVKPYKQTIPPPIGKNGKVAKNNVRAALTYSINRAKWDAAELFCEQKGWKFGTITEKNLP